MNRFHRQQLLGQDVGLEAPTYAANRLTPNQQRHDSRANRF